MLFKIAFKNIKKSFKDYFIYFLTLCIAVACFYMFNSLDSQAKEGIFASSLRLITIVSYVAIYVGITFLMASAALLSLNQLTDSEDSIYRYEILRKTGCDGRMIEGALFKQTGLFFLMPLVMALIHCVVGFRFFDSMLVVGPAISGTGVSILITTLVIGGIYGAYFLATYAGSRRIVGGGSSR